jgi:hypothetical protein
MIIMYFGNQEGRCLRRKRLENKLRAAWKIPFVGVDCEKINFVWNLKPSHLFWNKFEGLLCCFVRLRHVKEAIQV